MSNVTQASSLEKKVDSIVSIFENDTPDIQYCSIVDIKDGRGYTAGKAGFTSATGDLLELLLRYERINAELFKSVIPILKQRAREENGDVTGLESLPKLWAVACQNQDFLKTQDDLVDEWYKKPARSALKKYGLKSNLAYLIFYDTVIQHGDGNDPDSFNGIVNKMGRIPQTERVFLNNFLRARLKVLKNPSNRETRDVWRESVDRVISLRKLLSEGHFNLDGAFTLEVWGESFSF